MPPSSASSVSVGVPDTVTALLKSTVSVIAFPGSSTPLDGEATTCATAVGATPELLAWMKLPVAMSTLLEIDHPLTLPP